MRAHELSAISPADMDVESRVEPHANVIYVSSLDLVVYLATHMSCNYSMHFAALILSTSLGCILLPTMLVPVTVAWKRLGHTVF